MSKLLQLDFMRNGLTQLAYTAPWIPFFWYLTDTLDAKTCSRKIIDRMEFCFHYHLASSIYIFIVMLLKYHAHHYKIEATKHFNRMGAKVISFIQSACAWLALIGLGLSLNNYCNSETLWALVFYSVCQVGVIILPFIRLFINLGKEKSVKKAQEQKIQSNELDKKKLKFNKTH